MIHSYMEMGHQLMFDIYDIILQTEFEVATSAYRNIIYRKYYNFSSPHKSLNS